MVAGSNRSTDVSKYVPDMSSLIVTCHHFLLCYLFIFCIIDNDSIWNIDNRKT